MQSVCCKQIIRSESFKNSQTNKEELQVNFNSNYAISLLEFTICCKRSQEKESEVVITSTSFVKVIWKFREHLLFGCFGVCIYCIDNANSVEYLNSKRCTWLYANFLDDMCHIVSLQDFDVYVKKIHWFEIKLWSLRPGFSISTLVAGGAPGIGHGGNVVVGNKRIVGGAVYIS